MALTKEMPVTEAAGEFIGIAKFGSNVIEDLNASATRLMREKAFSNYFEGAVQLVLDMNKYDVKMLDVTGRFWAEIDFPEDFQRACRYSEAERED